jgi:Na+/H+ antiporter NhaD/arsenite permease-like protein
MELTLLFIFILGYVAITIEHSLKIDKLIPALMMMALCWTGIAVGIDNISNWFNPETSSLLSLIDVDHEGRMHLLENTMLHHFGKTAEILIFLMGAMAIVEMIDYFEGFGTIKKMIRTRSRAKLLWIISFLAFFLSSIIDNLTATIVLITILRKLMDKPEDRMWYAGFIIIAANAGGAWTPIGDVTTTMLWMAGKVTSIKLIEYIALPSLINVLLPLLASRFVPAFRGTIDIAELKADQKENPNGKTMLIFGLGMIVFVPIFKTLTHLPPYVGMMLSLSIVALVSEILSNKKISFTNPESGENAHHGKGPTMNALAKIEIPSVLFFLGILMTVAAMETIGMIFTFGQNVSATIPQPVFVTILGISSALIDNVPLVAASIGMFSESVDAKIWHDLAYAAGTGGSILIIGSAAGVVAMGMEKISFFWYLKNITLFALLGYLGGIGFLFLIS